jgi:hypothetical protein
MGSGRNLDRSLKMKEFEKSQKVKERAVQKRTETQGNARESSSSQVIMSGI